MNRFAMVVCWFALVAIPAQANFGLFRSRSSYGRSVPYSSAPNISYYYQPTYQPMIVFPVTPDCGTAPLVNPYPPIRMPPASPSPDSLQTPPPVTRQPPPPPVRRAPGIAVPESAPPSEGGPVVPPGRPQPVPVPVRTTSLKPTTNYFTSHPSEASRGARDGTVTFWNLSNGPLTLRAGGRSQTVASGRSLALELARDFVWQVNDRPEEVGRVGEGAGLTILIRK